MKTSPPAETLSLRKDAELELTHRTKNNDEAEHSDLTKILHELQVYQIELEMQNEALQQAQIELEASRNQLQDRYLDLYDFAPVGYITLTKENLISELNLTAASLLGGERKKLMLRHFSLLIAEESRDQWHRFFLCAKQHSGKQTCELKMQRVDGFVFDARLDCLGIANEGLNACLRVALTDITEQKISEQELRIAATAFESQSGMMITDPNGIILRINRAFTRLTGYSSEEALGRTPRLLCSERHDGDFYHLIWQELKEKGYWQGEVLNRRKNKVDCTLWLTISAVAAVDGSISHYVGTFSDITEYKEAEAAIHRLAYYDPLTQLPNRRLLQDRLGQALAVASRKGLYGAILFLDLDNFKALNDIRGHDAGDELLVELAKRLRTVVRESDTLARLGGDEFVVLLEDLSEDAEAAAVLAKKVAEKLNEVTAQPYSLKCAGYFCTTSIGIGLFRETETVEDILKHADFALYQAKAAGRNTLCFYDPAMQAVFNERNTLVNDLRSALSGNQFRLYFQLQVHEKQRILGAEVLLRWQHPDLGLVSPQIFIPLAEETGLIVPIGHWILETACAQLKTWQGHPHTRDLQLAVNISASQFHEIDFVEHVRRLLNKMAIDPSLLKLELTESLVLDNVENSISKMQTLRAMGVRFSMDDFGTGYSSLAYLSQLPLDQLKIDQSFVRNITAKPTDTIIVQTIIGMANNLGIEVIAEGVETEQQREFLMNHGCHNFQGYLFGKPMPLAEFEQQINRNF